MNDWFDDFDRFVKGTTVRAAAVNSVFDQIVTGMDKMPTEEQMNRGTRNYAVDTGSANAYAVSLAHVSGAYEDSQEVIFIAAEGNTTASTLNVSEVNNNAIVLDNNAPIPSGTIKDDSLVSVRWNAANSNWQLSGVFEITQSVTDFMATMLDDETASEALSTLGVTTYMKTMLDDETASAAQTTLGISAFIKTLIDDATADEARSTLEISGRNKIINGNFAINQRVVSGSVVLSVGDYGHDRFRAGSGGCTYTFATVANVTTITISAGTLEQEIDGENLLSGDYVLSWSGTAQGQIDGGGYDASGVSGALTGGTNAIIEFGAGTLSKVQLEEGSVATPFEQRPIGTELSLCQRYFQKSYNQSVVPASVSRLGAVYFRSYGTAHVEPIPLSPSMRGNPTIVCYNPVTGSSGEFRNDSNSTNLTAEAVTDNGEQFVYVALTATTDTHGVLGHFTAEAEL